MPEQIHQWLLAIPFTGSGESYLDTWYKHNAQHPTVVHVIKEFRDGEFVQTHQSVDRNPKLVTCS